MNNIILIGFMGCGKTSVGKYLSRMQEYHFVDTDKWIEDKEKKTIPELFASFGEAAFRQMETECIKELLTMKHQVSMVLSVGGGLVLKEENRQLLKQLGTIIFLDASVDTLYERLKKDTSRPLLQGGNPKERIITLLMERKAVYENCCDEVIQVDDKSFREIADEILHCVKQDA